MLSCKVELQAVGGGKGVGMFILAENATELLPKEAIPIFYFLLPGFLTAAVVYTLTAHPKGNSFERVVQALIYTVVIQGIVVSIRWFMYLIGEHIRWDAHYLALGPWTSNSGLLWSLIVAVLVGIVVSRNVHKRTAIFKWMQRASCSRRTASPSQWYTAFHRYDRYVILHLDGERRLRGWPEEWPDECDKGHFILDDPAWILDDGTAVGLIQVYKMLVPASDVSSVEFVNMTGEVTVTEDEIKKNQKPLIELFNKDAANAKPSTESIDPANGNGKLSPADGKQQRASADANGGPEVGEWAGTAGDNGNEADGIARPAPQKVKNRRKKKR
ncbi:MAG: hypothetical protein JWN51_3510 [Phycisphaerales bacterium]|nr:hypothetical protein [Phycisphaerales bacterium]